MARSRPDPTCTLTCREHLDFYLWDGDQIVHEVRRRSPAIAGSSVYYGRVTYTHGPGIDAPVSVYREGDGSGRPYSVILHMNHKGHIDMGTRPDGSRIDADRYDWAGLKWPLYPRLLRSTRANMHWLGSLITLKTDGTGLVYMRNRYYDPLSGQFTQEDPIGLAGGLNLYGYAGGDPVNFSDPFGLCPEKRDDGKECNMETGDPYLDDPQIRQRLEDAYNQAPKDRMFPQLTAEVGGWCTMSQCRVRTGRYSHVAAGRRPKGTILHFHTHPNVGERHPIWNTRVFGSGPSDPDRKAARGRPVSSYIIEPDRIYILTPDGGLTCHGRWTNSPGCP